MPVPDWFKLKRAPPLTELIHKNLRDHLRAVSQTNTLNSKIEGEIKAKLAEVNTGMKNLIEAVKIYCSSLITTSGGAKENTKATFRSAIRVS
ncbi:MAG: hypothetical protein HZC40_17450 [Chloroflexi bacterium]|nr:hypothetical protein [Chloroflexota bacterium]